jgi:hypothetical protein
VSNFTTDVAVADVKCGLSMPSLPAADFQTVGSFCGKIDDMAGEPMATAVTPERRVAPVHRPPPFWLFHCLTTTN